MNEQLIQRAESGDVDAMLELAKYYAMDEKERNMGKACEWADRAANTGSSQGYYYSMLSHSIMAQTGEGLSAWPMSASEYAICADRASVLLDAFKRGQIRLNEGQVQTVSNHLNEALFYKALAQYHIDSSNVENLSEIVQWLDDCDSSREKMFKGLCCYDLQDYAQAFSLLREVCLDRNYMLSKKRISEEWAFSEAMFDLTVLYRSGLPGVVDADLDRAQQILSETLRSLEMAATKKIISDELEHYQKKVLGGYKYL